MELQKSGNSPRPGPEVVEQAVKKVRNWTVQNEMRGVLGRVSARAAGRFLDSTNRIEIRT